MLHIRALEWSFFRLIIDIRCKSPSIMRLYRSSLLVVVVVVVADADQELLPSSPVS